MVVREPWRELFSEICRLTGTPFPNLVYRRLAKEPARLEACWNLVRDDLATMDVARLRSALLPAPPPPPEGRYEELLRVLDVYDLGNSVNAVLVRLWLDGSQGDARCPWIVGGSVRHEAPSPTIPPMASLDELPPQRAARLRRIGRLVEPSGVVVPSLFRHLAHDDAHLDLVEESLIAAMRTGTFQWLETEQTARVETAVGLWPSRVEPVADSVAREVLMPFRQTIPRMVTVARVLREAAIRDASRGGGAP